MDPVLQAERLKAAQELEALRRKPDEELVFSQTGASLLWPCSARNFGLRLTRCVYRQESCGFHQLCNLCYDPEFSPRAAGLHLRQG